MIEVAEARRAAGSGRYAQHSNDQRLLGGVPRGGVPRGRATHDVAASRLAPLNLIEVDTTLDHFVQRREISQSTHLGDHARRRVIDVLCRSCATQTKTNRAMGSRGFNPECSKHITWFE